MQQRFPADCACPCPLPVGFREKGKKKWRVILDIDLLIETMWVKCA